MFKVIWKLSVAAFLTCAISASVCSEVENNSYSGERNGTVNGEDKHLFIDVVAGIYLNDFKNFNRVLEFAKYSASKDFRAVILETLYDVMAAVNHTLSPLRAIPLYDEIEDLINRSNETVRGLAKLSEIRNKLVLNTIIPKGADILRAAVYVGPRPFENNTISELQNLLHSSNSTISNLAITRMVEEVFDVVPTAQLVPIFENLSQYVLQNVFALLALQKKAALEDLAHFDYIIRLRKLTQREEYSSTVPPEVQVQVTADIPAAANALLSGNVCISQNIRNSRNTRDKRSLYYLQRCDKNDQRACVAKNSTYGGSDALKYIPELQESLAVRFKNVESGNYLNIRPNLKEVVNGSTMNVFAESIRSIGTDLLLLFEDNAVVFSDINNTMTICSGAIRPIVKDVYLAYSRDSSLIEKFKQECIWLIGNC